MPARKIGPCIAATCRATCTASSSTRQRAETAVRKILAAGALRIISGGDHAILIPVLHATKVAGRLRSYIDVPRAKYKSMEGERTAA
jgi:hypothetical protein